MSESTAKPGSIRVFVRSDAWVLLLVLVGLIVSFGLLSEHFLSPLNLRTIANQTPPLLVVALGVTLVMLGGGIDLSVGSVLALASAVAGVAILRAELPIAAALLTALLIGAACGAFNAALVRAWRLPSFLVTLATLEIARGSSYLVTDSQTQYVGNAVAGLASPSPLFGLSFSFLATCMLVVVLESIVRHTASGRHLLALGGNEESARLAGVRTDRVRAVSFVAAGLLAGLGGFLQLSFLQSADPNAGLGLELSAIAAVVIGGTSLSGGRGSIVGTFLGVMIIAVLQSGLAQLGASEPTKRLVTGVVIVLAVVADSIRRRSATNLVEPT